MVFRQLAAAFLVAAFVSAGAELGRAQGTTTMAPARNSAGRKPDPAARNISNTGPAQSDGSSGAAGVARDQGTITRAGKDKPGRTGKGGSLPNPNVQGDPQHRCLSPAGVC